MGWVARQRGPWGPNPSSSVRPESLAELEKWEEGLQRDLGALCRSPDSVTVSLISYSGRGKAR